MALTFDAEHPDRPWCPPGNAERILETLEAKGVRATFFVQGRWAEAHPELAKRIDSAGHLIGNHSYYHARLPLLHDDGVRTDVHDGQEAIAAATGIDPRPWFRCPFGSGHDDARILGLLAGLGYRNVYWNVAGEDWEPWRTGPDVTASVVDGVAEVGDGAVVLLHTWPGGTADAVGPILDRLGRAGATFVRVDELESLP